jgi:hypothetical protein
LHCGQRPAGAAEGVEGFATADLRAARDFLDDPS